MIIMSNYGKLECEGYENGISYEVFLDNDFKYTIITRKNCIENIEYHQGVRGIFGVDSLDVKMVNDILDDMINKMK